MLMTKDGTHAFQSDPVVTHQITTKIQKY